MPGLSDDQLSLFNSLAMAIKESSDAFSTKEIVQVLVDNPWMISCRVKDTALLHIAAEHNNTVVGKALIGLGCHPDVRLGLPYGIDDESEEIEFSEGDTPLMLACTKGHFEFCQLLIDSGADVNLQKDYGDFALRMAVWYRHRNIVELLLRSKADPNLICSIWTVTTEETIRYTYGTALHSAGDIDLIRLLINSGANVNAKDYLGRTPLHHAALFNAPKAIVTLIKAGAAINARDNYVVYACKHQDTPLRLAIACGHIEATSVLLAMGANIEELGNGKNDWREHLDEDCDHSEALTHILENYESKR